MPELQKTFEHIFATWARNMFEHVKHEKKTKRGGKEGRREGKGLAVVWVLLLYKYEKFHVSSSKMFSEKLERNFRPNLYYIKFLSIVLIRVDF